jgi:cyclic pyranopterin phosphate synthase
MIQWAWSNHITPRFIELMPLGYGATFGRDRVVSSQEVRERLQDILDLDAAPVEPDGRGPAIYHPSRTNPSHRVGLISAVTENFCDLCNRVRVTAKGEIRACLASPEGLSLQPLLRATTDDEAIVETIKTVLYGKSESHGFHSVGRTEHHGVEMSRVGG